MPEDHIPYCLFIRSGRSYSVFFLADHFRKDPRVSLCASCDHNSVASCRLNKFFCFFRCSDIAVSDYRNGNRLFHLPDNVPVRLSAIILLSRPSVNRNRRRSRFFRRSCDFDCIYMRIVEPFSDFYRNGLLYCFNDRVYNLINKRGVFHQSRPLPVFYNFRYRTPHIDIENRKRTFFNPFRHLAHNLRIRTKQLQRYRLLFWMYFHEFLCIFILIQNCFCTNHFHP